MKKSQVFWLVYLGIAVLFALYGSLWGETQYQGFFYNLGRGLVWPVLLFPALGKVVAGVLLLVVIVAVLVLVK